MVKSVCRRRGRGYVGEKEEEREEEIKGARWNVWSVEGEGGGLAWAGVR